MRRHERTLASNPNADHLALSPSRASAGVLLDWERVNVWTSTLYTLIQSLSLAKEQRFGDLTTLETRVKLAGSWRNPDCSYRSVLTAHPLGRRRITFRRDPNVHFDTIVTQVI